MINILTKLSQNKIDELVDYLNTNVEPHLGKDVSSYAPGRRRIWLPYEAPLTDTMKFQVALQDERLWNFILKLCAMFDWQPDLGLVSKGGGIKPHRDAGYANFRAMGINLGPVTWCYEHSYPEFNWTPPEGCINPPEVIKIPMTGGEVFEFNSKNLHWTEGVDPDRWAFNLWTISRKKRQDFNEFLAEQQASA